jgi:Domain of unknown function (DUF4388)
MAIEGRLRELGIHDVFQLLDLSRKTGVLRVSSHLRDDEGVLYFDHGRVTQATIRSKAMPVELVLRQAGRISDDDLEMARSQAFEGRADIADALVRSGAISQRELERHYRLQLESAVFELMSWNEGFFSFEELPADQMPHDSRISVSTESLLMEGARRIDEWSRIADVIPDLTVILELAPFENDQEGAALDLLPHEWQVLTMIDGERDLRGIAVALGRDEFEIGKIAYGLTTTGIVTARKPSARSTPERLSPVGADSALPAVLARSVASELAAARGVIEQLLRTAPTGATALDARNALEALAKLQRALETQTNG